MQKHDHGDVYGDLLEAGRQHDTFVPLSGMVEMYSSFWSMRNITSKREERHTVIEPTSIGPNMYQGGRLFLGLRLDGTSNAACHGDG